MISLMDTFREGGPFAFLVLAAAMAVGPAAVVAAAIGLARVRVPGVVYLIVPSLVLALGLLGGLDGLRQVEEALAFASPEMRSTLAAAGFAYSQYTVLLAGWLMVPALLFGAVLAGLPRVARIAEPRRWTLGPALLAFGFGLVGGLGLGVFGDWGSAAIAVIGGFGVGLASMRVAEAPEEAAWTAPARVTSAGLGVCAGLLLAFTRMTEVRVVQHLGIVFVDPDSPDGFATAETVAAAIDAVSPLAAAAVVLLAGLTATAPVAGWVLTRRSAVHLGLLLVPLLPAFALGGWHEVRVQDGIRAALPWEEHRRPVLQSLGITLPRSASTAEIIPMARLCVGVDGLWIDDERVKEDVQDGRTTAVLNGLKPAEPGGSPWDEPPATHFALEADHRVGMQRLRPMLLAAAKAGQRSVYLVSRNEAGGLRADRLGLVATVYAPDAPHERPRLALEADGARLVVPGGAQLRLAKPEALTEALRGLPPEALEEGVVSLLVYDGATVQELVSWLDALLAAGSQNALSIPSIYVELALDRPLPRLDPLDPALLNRQFDPLPLLLE